MTKQDMIAEVEQHVGMIFVVPAGLDFPVSVDKKSILRSMNHSGDFTGHTIMTEGTFGNSMTVWFIEK